MAISKKKVRPDLLGNSYAVKKNKPKERVSTVLHDGYTAKLEALAEAKKVSKTALIREILENFCDS